MDKKQTLHCFNKFKMHCNVELGIKLHGIKDGNPIIQLHPTQWPIMTLLIKLAHIHFLIYLHKTEIKQNIKSGFRKI